MEYSRRRDVYPSQHAYSEDSYPSGYNSAPNRDRNLARTYSPPADKPPIPAGWVPQWNDQYQRWYYHDTTTGRSQWEAPGYSPSRAAMQGTDSGGYDGSGSQHGYGGQNDYTHKQKSSHGGMLLGAAGGLAAGALLSNALNDDDGYRSYTHGASGQASAYADSVSSSDRDSLDEARQEYAGALDDARSSSAGSSDRESLDEAREEYYSEQEDLYD